MKIKLHLDWKKTLVFLFVSAGLLYATESVAMAAGVLLLLLVADRLLADWEFNKQWKKEHASELKEIEEQLRKKAEAKNANPTEKSLKK